MNYTKDIWQFKYIINQILIIRGNPWIIDKLIACNVLDPFIEECVDLNLLTKVFREHWSNPPTHADRFALAGCLQIIKYLNNLNIPKLFSKTAMDWAAEKGHLEIVKWLHENRTEGCTYRAMGLAAENGHLAVVKWLHENRTEGCTTYAMILAAKNGHLNVLKYLYDNKLAELDASAMYWAAHNKHVDVVKWLYQITGESEEYVDSAMDLVEQYHDPHHDMPFRYDIIEFLKEHLNLTDY